MKTMERIIKTIPKVPLITLLKNNVISTKAIMVREIRSKFPIFFEMFIVTDVLVKQHYKGDQLKITGQLLLLHKDYFISAKL